MKTHKNTKQINLALIAMAFIFFGTEIIMTYISKEDYSTNQIRLWFAIVIGTIYNVIARQISETTKTIEHEKL